MPSKRYSGKDKPGEALPRTNSCEESAKWETGVQRGSFRCCVNFSIENQIINMLAIPWAKECHKNSTLPSCCKCSHSLVLELSWLSSNKTSSAKQVVVGQLWPRGARLPTPGLGDGHYIKTMLSHFLRMLFRKQEKITASQWVTTYGPAVLSGTQHIQPRKCHQCFFHSHESRAAGRPALIAIISLPHGMPAVSTEERGMISQIKLA